MSGQMKNSIDAKKIFYGITILSLLVFVIGNIITVTQNPFNGGVSNALSNEFFDHITMFVPFSIWAWLIIFAIFFVKKNWVVVTTCIILAIPHLILIAVLVIDSHSLVEILKWYVMILSFGSIVLK
ncbi:MAG: hypothetical protein E6Z87_00655 [Finegoldia magna]|nr:hypothetical protein [Finegoldia magna]